MDKTVNSEIRNAAEQNGVAMWQIAQRLGIDPSSLSRKLRKQIIEPERSIILRVISEISSCGEPRNGITASQAATKLRKMQYLIKDDSCKECKYFAKCRAGGCYILRSAAHLLELVAK